MKFKLFFKEKPTDVSQSALNNKSEFEQIIFSSLYWNLPLYLTMKLISTINIVYFPMMITIYQRNGAAKGVGANPLVYQYPSY